MLFINAVASLLSAAAVASALSHEPAGPDHHALERRACPRVNLSVSQLKKESARLSSLSRALASKSKANAAKSKSLSKKSKSLAAKSSSVARKAASEAAKEASLASKASSVNAKQSSVNAKSASLSSRQGAQFTSLSEASVAQASSAASLSSQASSISSVSSALAAATSAAANSNCYPLASLDVTLTSHAAGVSACATFCGASYNVVALVEPSSPPATCLCINADSLAAIAPASAASFCNAAYGSTDGTYVSAYAI